MLLDGLNTSVARMLLARVVSVVLRLVVKIVCAVSFFLLSKTFSKGFCRWHLSGCTGAEMQPVLVLI